MELKKSKFMEWKSEATLSQFVAWTLFCATDGETSYGKKLNEYSKEILFFLLFGKNYREKLNEYTVKKVDVVRESETLDIIAEIVLEKGSEEHKFALFLELKLYTNTSENQLDKYKKVAERKYKEDSFEKKFVLLVVWKDEVPQEERILCERFGFTPYTFVNVLETVFDSKPANSENPLFDEFWTGYW